MPRLIKTYDEYEFGLSWVLEEPMQRTSHALVDGGRLWLVDPVAVDDSRPHVEIETAIRWSSRGLHRALERLLNRGVIGQGATIGERGAAGKGYNCEG